MGLGFGKARHHVKSSHVNYFSQYMKFFGSSKTATVIRSYTGKIPQFVEEYL